MPATLIPAALGFAAAVLYLTKAAQTAAGPDPSDAITWLIGGVCLIAGYTLILIAARRARRSGTCKETA